MVCVKRWARRVRAACWSTCTLLIFGFVCAFMHGMMIGRVLRNEINDNERLLILAEKEVQSEKED